ncbi:type III effector HrpK [Pseudomonas syringae pv. actinidifoliorum]|uniref:pectate lyase n=1 Tax=Pseudomonas syringae TaxID=317 RepID=UPI0013729E76|nr:pectate lyase [Pseudomonas syringae]NAS95661.1 type III effector HrpK [Pseudomonas syringae pv. actinidifoliorum]
MSIGITPRPQQTTAPLDFSALSGKSPQPNTFGEQNTQQAIDPSALLFGSDKQKDVNFGTPDSTVQNPQDASKTNDSQSNIAKLISALIMSLLQMLTNSNKKQDANQEQPDSQAPFQNNGGLGTPSADSGGGGTPDATGGGGGDTPSATGGGGGGDTPTATGGGGGGDTPTATGGGGGGDTPTATGGGDGGVTPQITPQLANPGRTPGTTGSVADTAGSNDQAGKINVVRDTIKVGAGEVFDGHGATYTADKSMGNGDQEENQKPMFELAEGATLKNVNLGENEVDGIHVNAKNAQEVTIDNVHAQNVGEDMITVKGEGGAAVTNLNIKNSSAKGADDKVVQLNANTHLKIDNFKADDFGTMVRTNGGKQFDDMSIELNGIEANHGKFALVKSDSDDLKLATGNIAMTDVKHAYDKTQASTQHTEL